MKWWSLRHSQWTKISYLLYLPFAQKKIKKISDLLYCVEKAKNQRSPKISRFVMVCLLQLRLIFCCSCLLHCTYSWERERERERDEKQKVRCELLLSVVPKHVDVISNMWLLGTLGYVESRMCGGEKISSGQWYCYSWCTFCYLKG